MFRRLLETFFTPGKPVPRWWLAVVALVVVLLGGIFWRAAVWHGEWLNREVTFNDQKVYLNAGGTAKESGYTYFFPRTRMPLYALYVSVFHHTGATVEEMFPRMKVANVGLALAGLAVVAAVFSIWLGWGWALTLAAISGFTWFAPKAGYVQPEVLLALLIGLTCATLGDLLLHPRWWKGLLAGILIGLWHLTKASGPVVLMTYFIALGFKLLWPGKTPRKALLIASAAVCGGFLIPTFNYLVNNVEVFGSPFYNTQSKFYLWCKDVHEKHDLQKLDIEIQKPTPEELAQLPSARNFLAKNSFKDIRKRMDKGYEGMMRGANTQHTELMFALQVCGLLLLGAIGLYPRKAWQIAREHVWQAAFAFGIVTAFGLLFSWMQVIRVGPRMITSIHLVPLFFLLYWTRLILRGETRQIAGVTVAADRAALVLVLIPLAALTGWCVVVYEMPAFYFGG